MTIAQQIEKFGCELQIDHKRGPNWEQLLFRAICGGFSTPWRTAEEAVLNDVLMIKAGQNAEAVGKQNPHPNGRYASIEKGGV